MDEKLSEKPGRTDPCPCGANRKYKKCCERLQDDRQHGPRQYERLSIKNTVLEEIRSFKEIFGLKLTTDKLTLNNNITDSDVFLFVERVKNLWASKGNLLPQMPAKTDLKFRALYFGSPDILSTVNLLARYSLYCEERFAAIQEFQGNLDAQYQQFKREFEEIRKTVEAKLQSLAVAEIIADLQRLYSKAKPEKVEQDVLDYLEMLHEKSSIEYE